MWRLWDEGVACLLYFGMRHSGAVLSNHVARVLYLASVIKQFVIKQSVINHSVI